VQHRQQEPEILRLRRQYAIHAHIVRGEDAFGVGRDFELLHSLSDEKLGSVLLV